MTRPTARASRVSPPELPAPAVRPGAAALGALQSDRRTSASRPATGRGYGPAAQRAAIRAGRRRPAPASPGSSRTPRAARCPRARGPGRSPRRDQGGPRGRRGRGAARPVLPRHARPGTPHERRVAPRRRGLRNPTDENNLRDDLDDPSRKLIRRMLGAVVEYDREMTLCGCGTAAAPRPRRAATPTARPRSATPPSTASSAAPRPSSDPRPDPRPPRGRRLHARHRPNAQRGRPAIQARRLHGPARPSPQSSARTPPPRPRTEAA